jgi:hypothetical protein
MSARPVRQSSKDAVQKIRDILAWESCPESSELFKLAAERMEQEFEQVKRRRVQACESKSAYATPTMSEDEDSSDAAGSAPSDDDVDSMYSENLSESEGSSMSEYDSTDVEDAMPRVPAVRHVAAANDVAAIPDVCVVDDEAVP